MNGRPINIMGYIFEFMIELVLEGCIEVSKSRKIPNYIRYPLIGILSLFFIAVIGLVFIAGILLLKENIPSGILLILVGLFLLIMSAIRFRKTYLTKINKG